MTPTQRAAALRLAEGPRTSGELWGRAVIALLRELASEQDDPMPGMSLMNRTIAYCAADTLRKLGYKWDGEAWVTTEPQAELAQEPANPAPGYCKHCKQYTIEEPLPAEPVRECADNDSPWLICKPCAAVGHCAKLPVAWRSKERINGEFDSGWKLTINEPPQTPRTIAIEPLYTHPPQQRKPLMHMQIVTMWGHRSDGPDNSEIVSFARAIERHYGIEEAHGVYDHREVAGVEVLPYAPTYTEQQIADACMAAEVPDSKCESVLLALRA